MAEFQIDKEKLNEVNAEKDRHGWAELGGCERVGNALKTDLKEGLAPEHVERNRAAFGPNTFRELPPKSFFSILWEALKDPTLILLMVAATISTVLGAGACHAVATAFCARRYACRMRSWCGPRLLLFRKKAAPRAKLLPSDRLRRD